MSNILFSVHITEFGLPDRPPILHLPCEHEGDLPYFFAYEISYNGKHYVFEKCVNMVTVDNGEHIDVVGYKYYCPEEDTYKVFDSTYGMKRYYKFVIYKYFE